MTNTLEYKFHTRKHIETKFDLFSLKILIKTRNMKIGTWLYMEVCTINLYTQQLKHVLFILYSCHVKLDSHCVTNYLLQTTLKRLKQILDVNWDVKKTSVCKMLRANFHLLIRIHEYPNEKNKFSACGRNMYNMSFNAKAYYKYKLWDKAMNFTSIK